MSATRSRLIVHVVYRFDTGGLENGVVNLINRLPADAWHHAVVALLAEGVSNTVLKAMATGLPVVATRVGANEELIEAGVTGRMVPAGDSEALARDIVAYFDDPGMARRHGRAARHRAEQRFNLDVMVERYHGLYSELARNRPRAASKRRAAAPGPRANG